MEMDIMRQILVAIKELQEGQIRLEQKIESESAELKNRMTKLEQRMTNIEKTTSEIKEHLHHTAVKRNNLSC
ncbi:MAG: hypothetical protein FWE27_06615 [Defluviitaleaceae bacterium]|nr:hypothetical protein [Defluviitaleaceae bacterium]